MFDVHFVDVDLVQSPCCSFTIYKTITLIELQTILRPITKSNVMSLQVYNVPIVSPLFHTHVGITDVTKSECETKESPLEVRRPCVPCSVQLHYTAHSTHTTA